MNESEWDRVVGLYTGSGRNKEGETEDKSREKDKLVHTLWTVVSSPTWEALAGAVNGIAGSIVSAQTDLSTGFPEFATGTHWWDTNKDT